MATAFEKAHRAAVGVSVVDLRDGKTIVAVRQGELFIPASNQKLLTGAFALARLGGDFQFVTTVYRAGHDIVVAGQFDPTLGDPLLAEEQGKSIYAELDAWAAAIRQAVGQKLPGDIVLAARSDRPGYRHPDWPAEQHSNWYAAPVAPLNFNNNCFDVSFRTEKGAVAAVVRPESRLIRVVNAVKPGKSNTWRLQANADDSTVTLTGTVGAASTEPISVAVNDPPLLLGRALADRLARAGVTFSGRVRAGAADLAKAEAICSTATPLSVAMARANKRSLNMAGECIFLAAGDGTWEGSAGLAQETLAKAYGLDPQALVVRDGGGLSHRNAVAPAALTLLLVEVLRRPDALVLVASLPVAGVDGTMKARLAEPPYAGCVLAKTGYVWGVSTLSGYVLDKERRVALAFAVLCNRVPGGQGWQAKKLQDDICRLLADSLAQRPAATSP